MKVLISAYACEPGKGSEQEVGFRTVLAAARAHDVWVVTRSNNVASLRGALSGTDIEDRVRIHGIDLGESALAVKRQYGLFGLHWYYDRWQKLALETARGLHEEVGFDVAHHVTFASYWTRCGISDLEVPLVWGPVGGGVAAPFSLLPVLGWRGVLEETVRWSIRRLAELSPWFRKVGTRAAVALTQNTETSSRLRRRHGRFDRVFPNAPAVLSGLSVMRGDATYEVAFVGRLVPWKGTALAVRTMKWVRHPEARLVIFGDGPDRSRIERLVRRLGLHERVVLAGEVTREDVLQRMGRSGVTLHTALHEEAGLSVAESLALGTPLVYLAVGGPPILAGLWPHVPSHGVEPSGVSRTARDMAAAIDRFLEDPPNRPEGVVPPSETYDVVVLDAYLAAHGERR